MYLLWSLCTSSEVYVPVFTHIPGESYRRSFVVFVAVFVWRLSSANYLLCLLILSFKTELNQEYSFERFTNYQFF